jgi:lactoylglutathione lyase
VVIEIVDLVLEAAGCRQGWVVDPDGNRFEIMQMLPRCRPFEGVERRKQGLEPLKFSSNWPRP